MGTLIQLLPGTVRSPEEGQGGPPGLTHEVSPKEPKKSGILDANT